jgi:N-methylhydantoinase B
MSFDPITQEILRYAFTDVAEEMAVVEYRSSFSPIIREMLDFSCGAFDPRGRMVAHSEQIPAQLGLMQFTLQAALSKRGRLDPGDVLLCNHPYEGGTHTPDLQLFMPAYRDDVLVGYTGSIAHHIDIGGRFPGTESTQTSELFQEGLLFSAVKLLSRGRRNEELFDMIAANVRDPGATIGDLAAQIAACRRGVERIQDLCARFTTAAVCEGMTALLEQTSARAREELGRWPDRPCYVEGYMDHDGFDFDAPLKIAARVQVQDGTLHIDLDGTSSQVGSGVNVPWASTHAGSYFAVRCFIGNDIPQNDGLTRHVVVSAPRGTLLNPRFPAAVSARHLAVQRLSQLLCDALGELLPERAVAASQVSFPAFVFQAVDARTGRSTLLADILGGGGGADRFAAGDSGIDTYTSNCAILPAEVAEMEYPWRIQRTELVANSGGSGLRRGGEGIRRDYELLADEAEGPYYVEQSRPEFTARGAEGGGSAEPATVRVRRSDGRWERLPSKGHLKMTKGEVISFVSAGGGGYGRSSARDS